MTLEQQVRRFTINFFLNICPLLWAGDSIGQHQTSHSSFILIACDYLQKYNISKLLRICFLISALLKMERISARHKGDKQAVEMLKVRIFLLFWRCVVRSKLGLFYRGGFAFLILFKRMSLTQRVSKWLQIWPRLMWWVLFSKRIYNLSYVLSS